MSSIKLLSLFVKTLAKPVANQIKSQAKTHPRFRKFCIGVAQTTHRLEIQWKMHVLGYKSDAIRPLNDARAVDSGANFMGEAFIFSVAALIILAEQQRSRLSAKKQRNLVDDRLETLEAESESLREENSQLKYLTKEQKEDIAELEENLRVLQQVVSGLLTREMRHWSDSYEHSASVIDQEMLEKFQSGQNIDEVLASKYNIPSDHPYFRMKQAELKS
ncbi:hypothetical protein H4219_001472 [Mycoemilia scoparia]|uniref:OPA3-like protein n=1 Tax=Mycoemilia scoparia TaxID=417184 RepID=A0A9W8A0Z0_9FUNG|nr:hypothetical protein H4219_001472 [Mycoemilia scoparia]